MPCLNKTMRRCQTCFSKAKKAIDVANFYNNLESIWDGLIKKNKCYKLDSISEFAVEAGGAEKVVI